MNDQLNLEGGQGQKKWTFADGITEIKREQFQRGRVYPGLIGRGSLSQDDANQQNKALQGCLTFLEFCAPYQDLLRQVLMLLKSRPGFAGELREFIAARTKEQAP